jgi:hypothetical protein
VQVGPAAYRVHFEGGSHLDLLNKVGDMQRQLEAAEPGAGGHCKTWTQMIHSGSYCQIASAVPAEEDIPPCKLSWQLGAALQHGCTRHALWFRSLIMSFHMCYVSPFPACRQAVSGILGAST